MKKSDIFNLAVKGPYRAVGDNKKYAIEVVKTINYPKLMELIAQDMFAYPAKYDPDEMTEFRFLYVEFLESGLIPKQIRD